MVPRHISRAAAALVVALAGGAIVASLPVAAQMPSGAHPHEGMDARPGGMAGPHVEGHIAFLKAELGITDAQAPLWDKVAAAMREDVAQMTAAIAQARADRQAPETALARLETRARLAALRAEGEARFLAAFRPLYEALSAEQRQTADELLAHGRP
ncbi:MAG: Spy/CpxP family protein refolding chaperone [Stellaceae bacterium]